MTSWRTSVVGAILAASIATMTAAQATSFAPLPKPGTPKQVAEAVAQSTSIRSIPANLTPKLTQAGLVTFTKTALGSKCTATCSWGKENAKPLVILFGDSHAYMWAPAVARAVLAAHGRLILYSSMGCVVAKLHLYGKWGKPNAYNTGCDTWRTKTIKKIQSKKPALVVLAERTSYILSGPNTLVTDAEFRAGLATSMTEIKRSGAKVLMLGDNPPFANYLDPTGCVAQHPTAVQQCATPIRASTALWRDRHSAEASVAAANGVTFFDSTKWICGKKTCSPIIGNMVAYRDWSHISTTYSAYLSKVIGEAMRGLY